MKLRTAVYAAVLCAIIVGCWLTIKPALTHQAVAVTNMNEATQAKSEMLRGSITIFDKDNDTQLPIPNTEYTITDEATGRVIDSVKTDAEGKATSALVDYGTKLVVKEKTTAFPYDDNDHETHVQVEAHVTKLDETNQLLEYVKKVQRLADGHVEIEKVFMNMDPLMQLPELPNGCEIVSLTAVLNYYGFEVSKTEMADEYLPKEPFTVKNDKLYGPDPNKAYVGNPRNTKGAFFSYAPPIAAAAKSYLNSIGQSNNITDISGNSREQITKYLDKGIPVIIWTTLDLSEPKMKASWYLNDTGEYFPAPVNLHCVVLDGYEDKDNLVYVMNPLKGQVTYNADQFFKSYEDIGSHALIIQT